MGILGFARSVLPKTFSDALNRLNPSPNAAPPPFVPNALAPKSAASGALSLVAARLAPSDEFTPQLSAQARPATTKSAPPNPKQKDVRPTIVFGGDVTARTRAEALDTLRRGVIRTVFAQYGVTPAPSEAAIDYIESQLGELDFTPKYDARTKTYAANPQDGTGDPFTLKKDGVVKEYEFKIPIDFELQQSVLKHADAARAITASGRQSVRDLTPDERMTAAAELAVSKYVGGELRDKIGNLSGEQLLAAAGIGFGVGVASKTAVGGLIPGAGQVLLMRETFRTAIDAGTFAEMAKNAKSEADLDNAARFLADKIGDKGADALLGVVGAGGAGIGSGGAGNARRILDRLKMELPEFPPPGLKPATVGNAPLPPNGIRVEAGTKTGGASSGTSSGPTLGQVATGGVAGATGARGLEKPDAPPRIPDFGGPVERPEPMRTSIDGNGEASGLRFRSDYREHVSKRDFNVPRDRGIGGAHNLAEFMKVVQSGEIRIVSRTPHPTLKGVEKIEYQMQALDRSGKSNGQWKSTLPPPKTVYDPQIISDTQMMEMGRQAFGEAQQAGRIDYAKRSWIGYAPNGIKFQGYIDHKTGAVRSFFPQF
jgi:hypothetical protein